MDAYDCEKVQSFKKLGMTVEAITAYDDILLVAVKGGSLWQYKVTLHFDPINKRQKTEMSFTPYKTFSAKPVTKMQAVAECSMLIVVSDNMCHVYDLDTFELKTSLPETKGVTEFAIHVKEELDKNKKIQVDTEVKMCVAIGKKLKVLQWNGETFEEKKNDLVLSKPVKALMWCKDIVFVANAQEYFALKPDTGEVHDVLRMGNHEVPLLTKVDGNTTLLGHQNQSVFFNSHGHIARERFISWSGIPIYQVCDPPYVVAVLDKYVEVKTVDPSVSVQRMDIKRVEAVCQSRSLIFLLTLHNVHMLVPRPDCERVKQLLQFKHFELAIQIINLSNLSEEDKEEEVTRIQALWGVHLFCTENYVESMNMFLKLTTDPYHVIGMFPDYLPAKLQISLTYPEKVPTLNDLTLQQASSALIDYLLEKRKQITSEENLTPFTPVIMAHKKNDTLKTKDQALSVIDTTLLKCYLKTNDSLIVPLLRQTDNHVDIREAQKVLLAEEQFNELIILYEIHGMHEEALEMMKTEGSKRKSILSGTDMTVHYLQKLGAKHLTLIFKYAEWVFEMDATEGLKIFTENDPVVKELPRGHVVSFVKRHNKKIAILYLEHVIYQWNDTTVELHLQLARYLREQVTNLYNEYIKSKSGEKHLKAGEEPGQLGTYRKKLLKFLATSKSYPPAVVLTKFPLDCLFEERAILLGRMKRHAAALGIYVYILQDMRQAEEYCANIYNTENEEDRHVYLYLLQTYVHPPDPRSLGLSEYAETAVPKIGEALSILEEHAARIDLFKALDILPDDTPIKKLGTFLEVAMETRVSHKNRCQTLKSMEYRENLKANKQRIMYIQKPIKLSEDTCCFKCHRKIGKSVFGFFDNGDIAHYGCVISHVRTPSSDSHIL